jgi:anthranilate synthase/aminodeoxychorismate synthase-like glutamine amidotransferase
MKQIDILIIDNYDSFTYNLYQAIALNNKSVSVIRNDKITIKEITELSPKGIVLSPGPGHPSQSPLCLDIITQLGKNIPILGVCLGHQAIGLAFGGCVVQTDVPLHGKSSLIFHNRSNLFKGVILPFSAGRYHSLIIKKDTLPNDLIIDGFDVNDNIMAISHRYYPIYGVQFHPESILTKEGQKIIDNFLEICGVKKLQQSATK